MNITPNILFHNQTLMGAKSKISVYSEEKACGVVVFKAGYCLP